MIAGSLAKIINEQQNKKFADKKHSKKSLVQIQQEEKGKSLRLLLRNTHTKKKQQIQLK